MDDFLNLQLSTTTYAFAAEWRSGSVRSQSEATCSIQLTIAARHNLHRFLNFPRRASTHLGLIKLSNNWGRCGPQDVMVRIGILCPCVRVSGFGLPLAFCVYFVSWAAG